MAFERGPVLGVCEEQRAGARADAEHCRLVEYIPPGIDCYPLPPLNPFPLAERWLFVQVKH